MWNANVSVEGLEPFPPGSPMNHDCYHMGTCMGENLMLLHANHPSEECKYLILVNPKNGKRVKIDFEDTWNTRADAPGKIPWCREYREKTKCGLHESLDAYYKEFKV